MYWTGCLRSRMQKSSPPGFEEKAQRPKRGYAQCLGRAGTRREGTSMTSNRDYVLMATLNCGELDLGLLDGVGYDLCEIVSDLREEGIQPTLSLIMNEVFCKGVSDMKEYLDEMIEETRSEGEEAMWGGDHEAAVRSARKLADLHKLNPEEDITWDFNYIATDVGFAKNGELYRLYLPSSIKEIESNIGFSF